MLEPDAPRELVPKAAEWIDALAESLPRAPHETAPMR
jgi:hypothetical protein